MYAIRSYYDRQQQMHQVIFEDLQTIEYKNGWTYQEELFNTITEAKLSHNDIPGYLLFCEHPHVFTIGKSGDEANFLINQNLLQQINATYRNNFV